MVATAGGTAGPFTTSSLRQQLAQRPLAGDAHVVHVGTNRAGPLNQWPQFADLAGPVAMAAPAKRKTRWGVSVLVGVLLFVALASFVVARTATQQMQARKEPPPTPRSPVPAAAPVTQPAAEPKANPLVAVRAFSKDEILSKLRPLMRDTYNEVDQGTLLLASWADEHLRLVDVRVARDETSHAKVRKDSKPELGKRMCVSGLVVEIKVNRVDVDGHEMVITEGLLTSQGRHHKVYGVLSSGSIVDRSAARFCGYVTGLHAFYNVSGGETQTVKLVGMYDIPENRQ